MCLNPVNEEFDRAYANVGLLASDVWSFQSELSDYKRANLCLWIRFNEIEQRLVTEESDDQSTSTEDTPKVPIGRNTIPLSRPASYSNFFYDEGREKLHVHWGANWSTQYIQQAPQGDSQDLEAWMLPEVEQEFNRFTGIKPPRWRLPSLRITIGQDIAPAKQLTTVCPSKWLTRTKWPRRLLLRYPSLPLMLQDSGSLSLFKEDLNLPSYSEGEFPCPRYLVETAADLALHARVDSATVRGLWAPPQLHYGGFNLNADIPEFQRNIARPLQYLSIYDASYEADLFPYMNVAATPGQPDQGVANVYYKEYQPLKMLPVFIKPPELYFNVESMTSPCENHEGAVSSNLTYLIAPDGVTPSKALSTQKTLAFLDKWLSNIYNPRSNDFTAISSTSKKIDTFFQSVHQNYCATQEVPPVSQSRPLYSAVLMNETRPSGANESKYDELEREALEQYSGSDTMLQSKNPEQEVKQQAQKLTPTPPLQHSFWAVKASTEEALRCSSRPYESSNSHPHSLGSKRSSIEDPCVNACSPSKQAMWMKKKKKKPEKKKKCSKQKKKTISEYNYNCTESEIVALNKFTDLKVLLAQTFFESDWKLVQPLLTEEVINSFKNCLKLAQECSEWFKILIVRKDLKENFRTNKKRLELAKNIVDSQHGLLSILYQYIRCYSRIKMTILCDHRLFFDPDKFPVYKPVLSVEGRSINRPTSLTIDEYFQIFSINKTTLGNKALYKHLYHLRPEDNIKLPLSLEAPVNTNYFCIQVENKKGIFHFILDQAQPTIPKVSRMVRWSDDDSVWCGWQWMFSADDIFFSWDWLNQFRATSLKRATSSIRALLFYKLILDFIVFFNNKPPRLGLLWDVDNANIVSSRMLFLTLLVKRKKGWCFSDLRLSKFTCDPWTPICENTCCFSWLINQPGQATRPVAAKKSLKKEDVKVKGIQTKIESKITGKLSSDKQLIQRKIASREINGPEERQPLSQHSNCVLQ